MLRWRKNSRRLFLSEKTAGRKNGEVAPRRFSQISGAPWRRKEMAKTREQREIPIERRAQGKRRERERDEERERERRERATRGMRVLAALWRAPRVAPRRFGASDAETLRWCWLHVPTHTRPRAPSRSDFNPLLRRYLYTAPTRTRRNESSRFYFAHACTSFLSLVTVAALSNRRAYTDILRTHIQMDG